MAPFIVQMTDKEIREAIKFACERNKVPEFSKQIRYEFNTRFRTKAGVAVYSKNLIKLSTEIFGQFSKDQQRETVIHEACHLIAKHKHGTGIRAHGREWKETMIKCDLPANRCYTRDKLRVTKGAPVPLGQATFACACRKGLRLARAKAEAIQLQAKRFKCQHCNTRLTVEA
jgi:SprT protein